MVHDGLRPHAPYFLLSELRALAGPPPAPLREAAPIITPLRLKTEEGVLSLIGMTSVFGMLHVTLEELALETFFPADAESAAMLSGMV